jgi:hypothetical protein
LVVFAEAVALVVAPIEELDTVRSTIHFNIDEPVLSGSSFEVFEEVFTTGLLLLELLGSIVLFVNDLNDKFDAESSNLELLCVLAIFSSDFLDFSFFNLRFFEVEVVLDLERSADCLSFIFF